MNADPARRSGRIIEWDQNRGFGFLHDGTHRIFVHAREFSPHSKVPEAGDTVTFLPGENADGRACAKDAIIVGSKGKLRRNDFIQLGVLLIAPAFGLYRLTQLFPLPALLLASVTLSLVTAGVYAWDKHQAQTGGWRIAESTLHLLALIGGWPGAFLAQRYLRHKTAKLSFRVVFWLIVIAHQYLAADFALNWRLAAQLKAWL